MPINSKPRVWPLVRSFRPPNSDTVRSGTGRRPRRSRPLGRRAASDGHGGDDHLHWRSKRPPANSDELRSTSNGAWPYRC